MSGTEWQELVAALPPAYRKVMREHFLPPPPVFTNDELSTLLRYIEAAKLRPEGSRPFTLGPYSYLRPLYAEKRNAYFRRMVIMKASQTGLTIRLLMRAMWLVSDARQQINVALGFPTQDAVTKLAATRFRPMLNTSASMLRLARDGGVNQVEVARFGKSNMRFLGLRSAVSQDSNPIDAFMYDEVRLIPAITVERGMERISESTLRGPNLRGRGELRGILELNSTAGFPDQDIHRYFMGSTQGWWAVRCPDLGCRNHQAGIILPREFAENHKRIITQDKDGWYSLKCPRCGTKLTDNDVLNGFYIHENPREEMWLGFQFSQLVKGEAFLNAEIMPQYLRAINVPQFWNGRLGLPYMDRDAIPATRPVVEACMDDVARWEWPEQPLGLTGEWRGMGVDQRAGEKHVVIKTLMPNGLHRLDHMEVIEESGLEAVKPLVDLARQWGVKCLVMDGEPSYDLFVMVARAMPRGVVWQQDYVEGQVNTLQWEDKRNDERIRKSSGETKYEYRCLIDRWKGLDWSLGLYKRRVNLLPHKENFYSRRVTRTIGGERVGHNIGEEFVSHMGNLARYSEQKEINLAGRKVLVPGEFIYRWRPLNFDPHFVHANLYADAALARMHQPGSIHLVGEAPRAAPANDVEAQLPEHLRPSVAVAKQAAALAKACGVCKHFRDGGYCAHPSNGTHTVRVEATTPGCPVFVRRKEQRINTPAVED